MYIESIINSLWLIDIIYLCLHKNYSQNTSLMYTYVYIEKKQIIYVSKKHTSYIVMCYSIVNWQMH